MEQVRHPIKLLCIGARRRTNEVAGRTHDRVPLAQPERRPGCLYLNSQIELAGGALTRVFRGVGAAALKPNWQYSRGRTRSSWNPSDVGLHPFASSCPGELDRLFDATFPWLAMARQHGRGFEVLQTSQGFKCEGAVLVDKIRRYARTLLPRQDFESAQGIAAKQNVSVLYVKSAMTGCVSGCVHDARTSGYLDNLTVSELIDCRDRDALGDSVAHCVDQVAVQERPEALTEKTGRLPFPLASQKWNFERVRVNLCTCRRPNLLCKTEMVGVRVCNQDGVDVFQAAAHRVKLVQQIAPKAW